MKHLSAALLIVLMRLSALPATLDSNFQETSFVSVGSQVTGIAWSPDDSNRLFVTRKGGEIQIVKNGALLPTPFATVSPIYTASECGLIGICFDPNFIETGYVYVFVTVSSSEQQIIRYTAVGDTGTNKTVLVPGLPTAGVNHDGGAIGIGPDGKLYWAVGDNGVGAGVDDDMLSLASKVGRANLDGTVPADNPFLDGPGGTNDYIWARGFRNPYTLTFQPDTGLLWVNCVGTLYEQIFQVNVGDHAGWNDYENNQPAGYIAPKIKYRTNGTDTRSLLPGTGAFRSNNVATYTTTTAHGFRVGEQITVSGVGIPSFNGSVFVSSVPSPTSFTAAQAGPDSVTGGGTAATLGQGGAVLGGCFYDSTAVPVEYRGNFFYGDFNSGRVMRAALDASNEVTSVDYFGTGIVNYIDGAVGPDGALYYAGYAGSVFRLAYTTIVEQGIVVTPTVVRMIETGSGVLHVRLATPPVADVEVSIARTAGDSDIVIAGGTTLTFTPGNWSTPQTVLIQAQEDADTANDTAELTVSSAGLVSQSATIHAVDVLPLTFFLGPLSASIGQAAEVTLNGDPGSAYVLEGGTSIAGPWLPLSTNTLLTSSTNLSDSDSPALPMRFYRARRLP